MTLAVDLCETCLAFVPPGRNQCGHCAAYDANKEESVTYLEPDDLKVDKRFEAESLDAWMETIEEACNHKLLLEQLGPNLEVYDWDGKSVASMDLEQGGIKSYEMSEREGDVYRIGHDLLERQRDHLMELYEDNPDHPTDQETEGTEPNDTTNPSVAVQIQSVCDNLAEFLQDKNDKYGNSALDPEQVFSSAGPIEQIDVRIDDKISRIRRIHPDDQEDAIRDLAGYLILRMVAERREEA